MKEHEKMIIKVLGILGMEYPNFKFDTAREDVWKAFLKDISPQTIWAAVIAIMSSERKFAPTVGEVRATALRIDSGLHGDDSEIDAWENVLAKMTNPDHELTPREKKALSKIGKIWDLKHCKDISFERAAFYRAFRHVVEKETAERNTPPMVKSLIAANAETAPQLPAAKVEPGPTQYPAPTEPLSENPSWDGYTDEEKAAEIAKITGGLAGKLGREI